MNASAIDLQTTPRTNAGDPRLGTSFGANFAQQMRVAALPTRSNMLMPNPNGIDTNEPDPTQADTQTGTQAEPAPSQDRDPDHGSDPDAQTEQEGEDKPDVTNQAAGRVGASGAGRGIAGLVAGRARDLRGRTEHEMFGKADLAQMNAQELSASTPATQPTAATPPVRANAPAASSAHQSGVSGAESQGQSAASSSCDSNNDAGKQAAGQASTPSASGKASATMASSSDGSDDAGHDGKGGQSSNQDAASTGGPTPATTAVSSVRVTDAAPSAKASAATAVQPGATKSLGNVSAASASRSPAQLLKRLERVGPPASSTSADKAQKSEQPVPAAALRGLAAALRQGGGTVTMRLAPDALGSLKVIVSTQDSKVVAKFQASTEQARQLLSEHVETLRSAMESRGLSVDKIVVEHVKGGMPEASHPAEAGRAERDRHDSGGAGSQHVAPWNGAGQNPQGSEGHDGPTPDLPGQGRPGEDDTGRRGVGVTGQATEWTGGLTAVALTDESGPEQIIRLRVDAVA